MIDKYSELYSKAEILRICSMSKQGFSKPIKLLHTNQLLEMQVCETVNTARKVAKRIGARAIFYTYNVTFIGVNRFEKITAAYGLNVPRLKRKYIKTTNPLYEQEDCNLINGIVLNRPRQVIVGDITYVITTLNTFYVFTLKDAYSGLILALHAADNMKAVEAIKALKQAFKEDLASNFIGTIHHTDAGTQYKSNAYKAILNRVQMKMSIAGNCLENGIAEQLNGLVKNDYLIIDDNTTLTELKKQLKATKAFLNEVRKVKGLSNKTPRVFEHEQMQLQKHLRKLKTLYDFKK